MVVRVVKGGCDAGCRKTLVGVLSLVACLCGSLGWCRPHSGSTGRGEGRGGRDGDGEGRRGGGGGEVRGTRAEHESGDRHSPMYTCALVPFLGIALGVS